MMKHATRWNTTLPEERGQLPVTPQAVSGDISAP